MATKLPQLVAGYDRSGPSRCALLIAADLAAKLGAHLHVIHVVDLNDFTADPDAPDWNVRSGAILEEERAQAQSLLVDATCQWSYEVVRGEPVTTLLDISSRHDALMIVVGTRGEGVSAFVQHLLGGRSVSRGLLQEHRLPVLVVPPTWGSDEPHE